MRQALLFPVTVEVTASQAEWLQSEIHELDRLGFRIEPFGGHQFLVREVPALLGEADVASLVRDLADDLGSIHGNQTLGRVWDRLAATPACHAAVKVNFPDIFGSISKDGNEIGLDIGKATGNGKDGLFGLGTHLDDSIF